MEEDRAWTRNMPSPYECEGHLCSALSEEDEHEHMLLGLSVLEGDPASVLLLMKASLSSLSPLHTHCAISLYPHLAQEGRLRSELRLEKPRLYPGS